MLSRDRARRLKPLLDALLDPPSMRARIDHDPVRFPHRHRDPKDIEIAALVAACLAYGRAQLFLGKLEQLFAAMGRSPSLFAQRFEPARDSEALRGFAYRFNAAADVALLISGAGRLQREQGTLGAAFQEDFEAAGELKGALARFVERVRRAGDPGVQRVLGPPRAFGHLLPDPGRGGACKRLLLFLRWMVRGGPKDPIDFGLWKEIPASALIVPLDTHVARFSRCLSLTRRNDISWTTAEDVTASLRALAPEDPVKYDFALCHRGMSGACPRRRDRQICRPCALASACEGS